MIKYSITTTQKERVGAAREAVGKEKEGVGKEEGRCQEKGRILSLGAVVEVVVAVVLVLEVVVVRHPPPPITCMECRDGTVA